jgi:WD40 repeat protein
MWDTETGMQVNVIENTRTLSISFSPDGKKMVTTDGFNANILDAASGKKLLKLGKDGGFDERIHNPHNGHVGNVFSATFSPDGKYIVTTARGEGPCRIWDAELGKELCWLPHSDAVICAVFSPDGKKVVTGQEKTARIWDWERLPKLYVPPKVRDF